MNTDFESTNLLPLYTSFVLFTNCFYAVIYALVEKLFCFPFGFYSLSVQWMKAPTQHL